MNNKVQFESHGKLCGGAQSHRRLFGRKLAGWSQITVATKILHSLALFLVGEERVSFINLLLHGFSSVA